MRQRAAAVIAQRAGDLIASSDAAHLSGHVFWQLSNVCGEQSQASPIQENTDKTLFQRIYPDPENTCEALGKTPGYGEDLSAKTDGAYAWIIWRFYQGCQNGIGKFRGKTLF